MQDIFFRVLYPKGPYPQEPAGAPQLNPQPAFLILAKYLCGVGLFSPR